MCCIYHTKINELRLTLNQIQTDCSGLHGNLEVCDCACGVVCGSDDQLCQASNNVCKGIIQLWEAILCPKNEFDEWYKQKCLFGNCSRCGVDVLPLCPKEITRFDLILI